MNGYATKIFPGRGSKLLSSEILFLKGSKSIAVKFGIKKYNNTVVSIQLIIYIKK